MSSDKKNPTQRLERYVDEVSSPGSRVRNKGGRLWLDTLYCAKGHLLMDQSVLFDGLAALHLRARTADDPSRFYDFFLSPILNDARKQGPELPDGTVLRLHCPRCDSELPKLVPCTCTVGAYRHAVYLKPSPSPDAAVGICDHYGCPQSFVTEDGELLYEVVVEDKSADSR